MPVWLNRLCVFMGPRRVAAVTRRAALAWGSAGLIPFSVLHVQMFERLFKDERHEAWQRATDRRLKAMEADIEMLKAELAKRRWPGSAPG